jgi:hypothetical protein
MMWMVVNAVLSAIVAGIVFYKLVRLPARFTFTERLGMSLIGAGCLMTIGPILSQSATPFEDWAATLLRVGLVVYFTGRMVKHYQANRAAKRQAREHLKSRGIRG